MWNLKTVVLPDEDSQHKAKNQKVVINIPGRQDQMLSKRVFVVSQNDIVCNEAVQKNLLLQGGKLVVTSMQKYMLCHAKAWL